MCEFKFALTPYSFKKVRAKRDVVEQLKCAFLEIGIRV